MPLLTFFLAGCAVAPRLPVEPAPEVNGDRCSNRAIVRVAPRYPREALKNNQNGWVIAAVEYSPEGKVTSVKPVKASPVGIFEEATVNALSKWLLRANSSAGSCMQLMQYELRK